MSHIRPAHIHFASRPPAITVSCTHLFSRRVHEDINNDVVYGVKEPLVVEFCQEAVTGQGRRDGETGVDTAVLRGK